jgi:CxxC motif-containing protein
MDTTKREMVCIACPVGCHLTVSTTEDGTVMVEGNRCQRGVEYGREELLAPKRVVTATMAVSKGNSPRVPVKTDAPLLKDLIPGLLDLVYKMEITAPVALGMVVLQDIGGTGVRLVTTRSVGEVAAILR